ncbi:hypothetical protein L6164_009127 [Bauhinia variegata]|uniref:Uncharacterized protein n=1 Tax=Bauhinia variegata TaxID=167791 RepID=A0ACB9PI16_BAUVA|nr:hypothetical protein L6164_009127 [Bauhinia variegata]
MLSISAERFRRKLKPKHGTFMQFEFQLEQLNNGILHLANHLIIVCLEPIMSSAPARIGRHRQRYEDNLRLVSGCIPYRWRKENKYEDGEGDAEDKIEVLMVSSPNRDDLVFPKGGWENDETVIEAACREALEEAGVKGIPREIPLGKWEFRSKSSQDICSLEGGCRGYMFALEVTEELETWPEQKNRDRHWLSIREAFRLCRYEWMRRALEEFLRVMAEDRNINKEDEIVDSPSISVSNVSECQIMASNSYKRPSTTQHIIGFSNESMDPNSQGKSRKVNDVALVCFSRGSPSLWLLASSVPLVQ